MAYTGALPATAKSPSPPCRPLPAPADQASILLQAREQLAAGSDPRRGGAADGSVPGTTHEGELQGMPSALPGGAPAAVPPADAATTSAAFTLGAWSGLRLGWARRSEY